MVFVSQVTLPSLAPSSLAGLFFWAVLAALTVYNSLTCLQ